MQEKTLAEYPCYNCPMNAPQTTPQWLLWAQKLQSLAQSGLAYCKNPFDIERYHAIQEIAAEIIAAGADTSPTIIRNLFDEQAGYATPKVDVRGVVFRDNKVLLSQGTDGWLLDVTGWLGGHQRASQPGS